MKKIFLVTLFFIFSLVSFTEEAYIASFNVLRLGDSKEKDIVKTAQIISVFDIVGLVEVINKSGVEELVDELNRQTRDKWDYHISKFGVGSNKHKEFFAYVYKKDRVKFLRSEGFYKDGKSTLLREPYGASFRIGKFDFTLVLVHTIYGDGESQRKAENLKMVKVYDYFQAKDKKEQDIIIAGDFNLYALDESFKPLLKHEDNITYAIEPSIKTTLSPRGRANSYDNMFLSTKYTNEFTGVSGALDFTEGDYKTMREKISDHIPVFIVVDISKDDD
ncbi:MAG: endonuclease/exonuclease/phosphatase family protein [Fusobacterium sp.]|uniref:endonuclease/exonuclease/phosphatase family protein n=1 Tax=Fusobacterium sp. TaxID=68766 RepID=UPI0026DC6AF6|nr:endonuclease/exonuclease/phosphatase family protein [Fusobacterium sp.]MDO4690674.1 endonuclease/exonuclease/phosphatase family protein [Fusobacterium sp.]